MTRVPIKRVYQATFYFKDQNPLPCLENSILSFLGLLHFHLVSTSCLFPTLRPSFIFLIYHTVFSARNILLFLLLTSSSLRPTEALLPAAQFSAPHTWTLQHQSRSSTNASPTNHLHKVRSHELRLSVSQVTCWVPRTYPNAR